MSLELGTTGLQMLADALRDGVVLFGADERARFVNAAACRLLGLSAPEILGSGLDAVAARLVSGPEARARLRAGESIRCEADRELPVRATWVRLAPTRSADAPPSALVLHDASLGVALRRVEDVLLGTATADDPAANDPVRAPRRLLDHPRIARYLAREVRTSRRTGDPVSVAVVAAPARASAEHVGRCLARILRGADRVGRLHVRPDGATAPPAEITAVDPDVDLDPAFHWFLVVFPDTPATGAHAAVLRLRSQLEGEGALAGLRFGTATLHAEADLLSPRDTARDLVERAVAACTAAADDGDAPRAAAHPSTRRHGAAGT